MELMQAQIGDLIYDGETWGLIVDIKHQQRVYVVEWYARGKAIYDSYSGSLLSHIMNWRQQAFDSGAER
jgi:hypothetical protein